LPVCIYNEDKFPTAAAFGHTLDATARVKSSRQRLHALFPKGAGGNASASRASREAIGKEAAAGDGPACVCLFSKKQSMVVGKTFDDEPANDK
jgi:hypothetical protein